MNITHTTTMSKHKIAELRVNLNLIILNVNNIAPLYVFYFISTSVILVEKLDA